MNLRDKVRPLVEAILTNPNCSLLSIHLNDNDFSPETKEYLFSKLRVNKGRVSSINNPSKILKLVESSSALRVIEHDLEKTIEG